MFLLDHSLEYDLILIQATFDINMQSSTDANIKFGFHAPLQETIQKNRVVDEVIVPASVDLPSKLVGDVAIACGVTFLVAPFLTVVDKAIVQSAAGSRTLVQSGLESVQGILRSPGNYLKSPTFLLMWGVYAATYSTANTLKTISEHQEYKHSRRESDSLSNSRDIGKMGVFLGTTFVNSSAALLKDQAYAKMFGTNSTSAIVPKMTYACWIARDFSVIGSSFILPDLVSGYVANHLDIDEKSAKSISQLALPVLTQFVAGPLHYIGLDLYNRDLSTKAWSEAVIDRSKSLYRGILPVIAARIARIAPGYGIGGVLNTNLRDGWREYLVEKEQKGPSFIGDLNSVGTIFQKKRISL